jgi:asparagine N-glycosylation enzyme membrane subunit Stt3
MKVHVVDTIRGWLGWCQNVPARIQRVASEPYEVTGTPSGSGSFKEGAFRWLGLFRNQMLLLAIWFSVVGYLLLVTIGDNNVLLFTWGLLAGLGLSAFTGFRFWGTMNEVLESGAVFLATLYDKQLFPWQCWHFSFRS